MANSEISVNALQRSNGMVSSCLRGEISANGEISVAGKIELD